jgi:hypothetical protein
VKAVMKFSVLLQFPFLKDICNAWDVPRPTSSRASGPLKFAIDLR